MKTRWMVLVCAFLFPLFLMAQEESDGGPTFEALLRNYDLNKDGILSKDEKAQVKKIVFMAGSLDKNLIIKDFPMVEQVGLLGCKGIKSITIENMPALTSIQLMRSPIKQISISNADQLDRILINDLFTEELTFEDLPLLDRIDILRSNCQKLTVENLPNLRYLNCSDNKISELNLIDVRQLKKLDVFKNELNDFGFETSQSIEELQLGKNGIKHFEVKNLPKLKRLDLRHNELESFSLNNNNTIEVLDVHDNQLKEIELSCNEFLKELDVSENQLVDLDVSDHHKLERLNLRSNPLKKINLDTPHLKTVGFSKDINLETLICNEEAVELIKSALKRDKSTYKELIVHGKQR